MHSYVDNKTNTSMAHLSVHTVIFRDSIMVEYRSNLTTRNSHLFSLTFSKHSHTSTIDANQFQRRMSNISLSSKSRSISCPSMKSHQSMRNTLTDLWQEFNQNPNQPSKRPVKLRWRTFVKVVVSLLTFTRTKKQQYQWIQLVGHPGTFKEGRHDGFILKELCPDERNCYELLQTDILKDFIPKYNGVVRDEDGKLYIEIEDLLATFHEPCIMDCKIGIRTYLEEELDKAERDPKPRADLYNKMIAIDQSAPTEQENADRQILKPRYMIWRESISSTENLGFRIEAIKKSHGLMSKDFHRIKQRDEVKKQLNEFLAHSLPRTISYLHRLRELRSACLHSKFIQTHELIGSSILFIHDEKQTSLRMIDFGKTRLLPPDMYITHRQYWQRGSHEDGYLLGLDNLISLFEQIIDEY